MTEQQKKKKPRKQSHKEEEEEKITRKHKTKKRREQSSASIPKCLAKEKSLPQRFKVLSETNEEDKGFMQIALPKQKATTQATPTPKRTKIIQRTPEVKEFVIPSITPRWIKTQATKANPKFSENEWTVSFTGNKENLASSS